MAKDAAERGDADIGTALRRMVVRRVPGVALLWMDRLSDGSAQDRLVRRPLREGIRRQKTGHRPDLA